MDGSSKLESASRVTRMVDVARAAGVSRVTVSRVLSHPGSVSPDRQAAVLSAAKNLNYRRNFNAGVLAGGRALIVGALVSDLKKPEIAEAVSLLSDALTASDFHLFVGQSHGSAALQKTLMAGFLERRVDAVVVLGPAQSNSALSEYDAPEDFILHFWDPEHGVPGFRISNLLDQLARLPQRRPSSPWAPAADAGA